AVGAVATTGIFTIMVTKCAVVAALSLLVLAHRSLSLSCIRCHEIDCPVPTCSYGVTKDVCGCCDECAKGPGETCGGPWGISGSCSEGLECKLNQNIPGPDFNKDGVCVTKARSDDDCVGFCTADWRPVCGSDGKTYSNECGLNGASCRNPYDNIVVAHRGECRSAWTPEGNACIKGNNNLVLDRISLDDCKARCEIQTGFDCRSLEYHPRSRRCSLSEATSNSNSYRVPCPNKGWLFTETIGIAHPGIYHRLRSIRPRRAVGVTDTHAEVDSVA
ncbi:unnamed protein product, partial [Meganyctiphanes norvegica]